MQCKYYALIRFKFLEHLDAEHTLFVLDPTTTFVGGLHSPTLSRRRRDKAKDFVGCINDVRFNGHLLDYYNGTTSIGKAYSVGRSSCNVLSELSVICIPLQVIIKCLNVKTSSFLSFLFFLSPNKKNQEQHQG